MDMSEYKKSSKGGKFAPAVAPCQRDQWFFNKNISLAYSQKRSPTDLKAQLLRIFIFEQFTRQNYAIYHKKWSQWQGPRIYLSAVEASGQYMCIWLQKIIQKIVTC